MLVKVSSWHLFSEPWLQPTLNLQVPGWRSPVLMSQALKPTSPWASGELQSTFHCPTCPWWVLCVDYPLCVLGKNTTLHYLWISGRDNWSSEWPVWGPVWSKRKDEHVPGSFCHLWLQICHRNDVFWRAGLPPNISPSCDITSLMHWHTCVNRGVSAGVRLRQSWEVAADRLRSGSRSQNDGFLWNILWYSLSSTKARYCSVLFCLCRPHSISSSLTCLSQIWSPSLTSRLAPWRTGVWPPTGRRAF